MECVFFLFAGRVFVVLLCLTGIRTDKEPTGRSPLSILEPSAVMLNFALKCQYFFLLFLKGRVRLPLGRWRGELPRARAGCGGMRRLLGVAELRPPKSTGIAAPIAVCVKNFIPLASGAWHAPAWAKVSAP